MTLNELEDQVAKLPPEQFEKFRRWFHEFENRQWDRQIDEDVASGRIDDLANEAIAAHRNKLTKPL